MINFNLMIPGQGPGAITRDPILQARNDAERTFRNLSTLFCLWRSGVR